MRRRKCSLAVIRRILLAGLALISGVVTADMVDKLPEKGMQGSELELDLTVAARAWAKAWHWQQDVIYGYSVDTEWTVMRNPLSGEVIGRELMGIIVLRYTTHPSKQQCRFHYVTFTQQYSNNRFDHTRMINLLPVQHEISCDKI